jgi:hypothetical protein
MPKTTPQQEMQNAFHSFLEYTPPGRLSRGLRSMLLLLLEYEGGMLPDSMKDLPVDMERLFELLDKAEDKR